MLRLGGLAGGVEGVRCPPRVRVGAGRGLQALRRCTWRPSRGAACRASVSGWGRAATPGVLDDHDVAARTTGRPGRSAPRSARNQTSSRTATGPDRRGLPPGTLPQARVHTVGRGRVEVRLGRVPGELLRQRRRRRWPRWCAAPRSPSGALAMLAAPCVCRVRSKQSPTASRRGRGVGRRLVGDGRAWASPPTSSRPAVSAPRLRRARFMGISRRSWASGDQGRRTAPAGVAECRKSASSRSPASRQRRAQRRQPAVAVATSRCPGRSAAPAAVSATDRPEPVPQHHDLALLLVHGAPQRAAPRQRGPRRSTPVGSTRRRRRSVVARARRRPGRRLVGPSPQQGPVVAQLGPPMLGIRGQASSVSGQRDSGASRPRSASRRRARRPSRRRWPGGR